jgi:hypothetical protein
MFDDDDERDEKELVKRLLICLCSLIIWFKSHIGSQELGVWMDRICICDVSLYISFVADI